MKKEIFAVCMLVLLFTGALLHIRSLSRLTGMLSAYVEQAELLAENGKWDAALKQAETAADKWKQREKYTHIFLRHSEIDAVEDAFCALMTDIHTRNAAGVKGTARLLLYRLENIKTMEQIRPGSIF